eukprot:s354_g1.t1
MLAGLRGGCGAAATRAAVAACIPDGEGTGGATTEESHAVVPANELSDTCIRVLQELDRLVLGSCNIPGLVALALSAWAQRRLAAQPGVARAPEERELAETSNAETAALLSAISVAFPLPPSVPPRPALQSLEAFEALSIQSRLALLRSVPATRPAFAGGLMLLPAAPNPALDLEEAPPRGWPTRKWRERASDEDVSLLDGCKLGGARALRDDAEPASIYCDHLPVLTCRTPTLVAISLLLLTVLIALMTIRPEESLAVTDRAAAVPGLWDESIIKVKSKEQDRASCGLYGCGDLTVHASCHCNKECEMDGTCCQDYQAICKDYAAEIPAPPKEGSCKDYGCLNVIKPENSCQCTASCRDFSDCCEDFEDLCGAKSFIKLEVAPKEKHHDDPEADFFPKNSAKACVAAIGEPIGRGCYGTCHEARLSWWSLALRMVLKFARLDGPVASENVVVDEARTAKDLSHPNLVEIMYEPD